MLVAHRDGIASNDDNNVAQEKACTAQLNRNLVILTHANVIFKYMKGIPTVANLAIRQ